MMRPGTVCNRQVVYTNQFRTWFVCIIKEGVSKIRDTLFDSDPLDGIIWSFVKFSKASLNFDTASLYFLIDLL